MAQRVNLGGKGATKSFVNCMIIFDISEFFSLFLRILIFQCGHEILMPFFAQKFTTALQRINICNAHTYLKPIQIPLHRFIHQIKNSNCIIGIYCLGMW